MRSRRPRRHADLLDVERAVGERSTFERLDGFEQQENGPIVDRQWIGGLGPPSRASLAALQKFEAIRIKERAPHGRHVEIRVTNSRIDSAKRRQEPRPRRHAMLQDLGVCFCELGSEARNGVVSIVGWVAK